MASSFQNSISSGLHPPFSEFQTFGGAVVFKILLAGALSVVATGTILWLQHLWFFWIVMMVGGIFTLVFSILLAVFRKLSMVTTVSAAGIEIETKPLSRSAIIYRWDEMEILHLVHNPSPGSYGNRWTSAYGQVYAMNNAKGIQLLLKDGRSVFIGSNKPDDLFGHCKKYIARVMIA
ncbi:MAG: hypothetical protein ABIX01_09525 [Chitinophagaceae bacterium]